MKRTADWKWTEAGPIPQDWSVRPLGELYEFRNGVNADKQAYGRGYRFVNVLESITYSHLYGPEIPGRVSLPSRVAETYRVRRGDVLFNRTSETDTELGLAASYQGDEHVVFGGFVIRGRPKDDSLDSVYAGYALRATALRVQIVPSGQGAVRANIGQDRLAQVFVPVPPLPEQKAIAGALGDVDELIYGMARIVHKKRELKQAAMQQLLTGRTRLARFAGEWRAVRLGEIFEVHHGKSQKAVETLDGRYPILASGGKIGTASSWLHDRPSLLIGRKGTIDKPQYVDTPFWTVDTLFYTVMKGDNVAKYFYYRSCLIDWMRWNEASGVPSLNARTIEAIELGCPPPEEQAAIVAVLSDMDAEIDALNARLEKTRALKQAMMQELLTGRTRLV